MAELRIGCLVMAAGSGSRFGRNKLEAVVDGKSLLRRSLEAVPAEEFAQVTVVTQYDAAAALAGADAQKRHHVLGLCLVPMAANRQGRSG